MSKLTFQPNLILTIIAILAFGCFGSLGIWQLNRSHEKENILKSLEQKLSSKPIPLQALSKEKDRRQYQPIFFQGNFLNKQQFLLDNRVHKGKVGYEVITPILIKNNNQLVLVNRGWIPATKDRRILPKLDPVFGLQKIHGIIRIPLAKPLVLKTVKLDKAHWPIRIQQLDFERMSKLLGKPVYLFVVLLDKNSQNGFVRQWKFINMQPAKHVGYAVQWFSFAIVLLIIYLVLTLKWEKNNDNQCKVER